MVLIDLQKAIDTIDYQILIKRMKYLQSWAKYLEQDREIQ